MRKVNGHSGDLFQLNPIEFQWRFEIRQAFRQEYHRGACQISGRLFKSKSEYRSFEAPRDLAVQTSVCLVNIGHFMVVFAFAQWFMQKDLLRDDFHFRNVLHPTE